jgi:hypothetical protein
MGVSVLILMALEIVLALVVLLVFIVIYLSGVIQVVTLVA